MSDNVISVEHLSKLYRLGEVGTGTLSHDLNRWWHKVRGKDDPYARLGEANDRTVAGDSDYVWALKDIDFDVKRGQVLGIIGRNGAGKSTLLKILSRVTTPTAGIIKIKGRIASLLEVGTGFNPQLTGRENIYLNGAILGMRKSEIDRKFDRIVAFAEVSRYIDTPVKRYSSGMYVRLAFAVAAHLEPEILIVDEVLAVGDAEFQKRCLGKMQDVSAGGRTVIFVSHNMAAVTNLCEQSIFLEEGSLKMVGPTKRIVDEYLQGAQTDVRSRVWNEENGEKSGDARFAIKAVRVVGKDGDVVGNVDVCEPFTIEIEYRVVQALDHLRICLRLVTSDGTVVFSSAETANPSHEFRTCQPGIYVSYCTIPANLLNEGAYSLTIGADVPFKKVLFLQESAVTFHADHMGVGSRFAEKWPGVIRPQLNWETIALVRPPHSTSTPR